MKAAKQYLVARLRASLESGDIVHLRTLPERLRTARRLRRLLQLRFACSLQQCPDSMNMPDLPKGGSLALRSFEDALAVTSAHRDRKSDIRTFNRLVEQCCEFCPYCPPDRSRLDAIGLHGLVDRMHRAH